MEVAMPAGVKTEVRTYQMYINGEWVESKSSKTFPIYDPATEEVIAQVPDSNADDVNRAVAAAKSAFEDGPWASTTAQERGRVLFLLAEKIRQNAAPLAELEARNCGKPIVEAEYDINDVATCFEYYGGLATKILGYVNPVPDNAVSLSLKEPVGVAGQIIPWNYPLMMAAWKLAPALAAGCTCVLKPAEQTPLTALEMANWLADVGLPPGVVNIITGFGESCGAPLVQHPDVNKIAFTGSAAVGKVIGKQEAKLAVGGGRAAKFAKGYYVEPTIFYDVDNSARIAREEIFGPVAAVIPFEDEKDAVKIANDSPYGLAAAVWTRDIFKAFRAVKALKAGIVWVNHMQPTYVEAPWGGYKQSGFGRELGPWGVEEYLETKQVHINLNEAPIGWY